MPLPGGPSDKFGNRYELWWTVSQLVRMLHGQAESIRIEDPGLTKAEFLIVSQGRRELHQAKRSHPSKDRLCPKSYSFLTQLPQVSS